MHEVKEINLRDTLEFQLAKIAKLKRRLIDVEMKEIDFSRTQWQVLLWLKILGPCLQKELLKNLEIDAAHVARILEEFEKKQYIIRTQVAGNRRALFIKMTKFSEEKLVPHLEMAIEKERTILNKGLNLDEKNILKLLLQKLEKNLLYALESNYGKEDNE